ncbi:oxygen-regulated invasion protein OrgB [Pseudomonas chlororaphis subsp. aurantiaca]|uniref:oxygen-regulated invasion protein OrgB n=1 Tax=Pseudomonas chlororaphis TaxID=587753 RepID=UPI0027DB5B84|nr:oxygen-regulated invasion protein OrgB [Pseudomonas chlororaphis]WMI97540.1 oxygen-regulated invasion protein OrgB [Pseudomonas chlororaphis subsp. aurantiaca]
MLDSIRTLVDIPANNDLVVTRQERTAARDRRLLMLQARERAKACIIEAEKEAEAIRGQAFQEGFSQGVLRAAGDLSDLLLQARAVTTTLQTELQEAAGEMLGDLLKDDQLLAALLQRWRQRQVLSAPAVVEIILPLRCKPEESALRNALSEAGEGRVEISFHPQERYLFRQGDQVIELDVAAAQERLAPRLLAQLKQLPQSVRELDEASTQLFIGWAEQLKGPVQVADDIHAPEITDEG